MIEYEKLESVGAMALVKVTPFQKEDIIRKLTISSTGENIFTLHLYQFHLDKDKLYVPRALINENIVRRNFQLIEHCSKIVLRPNQIEPVNDYIEAVNSYSPYGGIIKAPTGTGKTVMAIEIAARLHLKTLVVVPLSGLMNQWIRGTDGVGGLIHLTNLKESDIGIIQQNKCIYKNKTFTIAMLHSLVQRKYVEDIYNEFGLVIFDEVHTLGAETFSKVASMFNCQYRLGLSATPHRRDGMGKVFTYHIGKVVGKSEIQKIKPTIHMIPYRGLGATDHGCAWGGKLSLGMYYNRLMRLEDRTELICNYIDKAYAKDRNILVLTERLVHIDNMHLDLTCRGISDSDIGIFTAKIKQSDRPITLATYGSFGMGIDVARLDTLIIAMPRVHVTQAVGRITREYKGKLKPVVIDIVDMASLYMRRWAKARIKTYNVLAEKLVCDFQIPTSGGGGWER